MKKILPFLSLMVPLLAIAITSFTPPKEPPLAEIVFQTGKKWTLNKEKSNIEFSVVHMVVSSAEGYFKSFDGSMEAAKADFSDAKINFKIEANSIDTDSESRDKHLKAEDFFNVAKYPHISFASTSFKPLKGKNYELSGQLTIKDVTRPVVFKVIYEGAANTATGTQATFRCTTVIDRFDYNLKWSKTTEAGGLTVGNEVTISAKIVLNQVK